MKKILLIFLLLCSFATATEIYYGDGNCDLEYNQEDINIILDLLNNDSIDGRCCLNETTECANMDMNKNGTFDSNDLTLLTETIYNSRAKEIFTNLNISDLLNFYSNTSCNATVTYIHNETWYEEQLSEEFCNETYNITTTHINLNCTECPTCPEPITHTVIEKETVEVVELKDDIWNWKVALMLLFVTICGLFIGYVYGANYVV